MFNECLISIYPTKAKDYTIVVLNDVKKTVDCQISALQDLGHCILALFSKYKIKAIVVNNPEKMLGKTLLKMDLKNNLVFLKINISLSEIKNRYFAENKPVGLMALIPAFFRKIPCGAFEKYSAIISAEKFVHQTH